MEARRHNTSGGTGILPVPMLTRGWNSESEDAVVARRSKLNWLIAGVAVQAFSAAVALAEESPAKPTPTFSAQFLYWAPARPILCQEWYVVLSGTVLETHEEDLGELRGRGTAGTMSIERIFLNSRGKVSVSHVRLPP